MPRFRDLLPDPALVLLALLLVAVARSAAGATSRIKDIAEMQEVV